MEIPDDDVLKLSEGMDEEATELHQEPKKEAEHSTNPAGGVSG